MFALRVHSEVAKILDFFKYINCKSLTKTPDSYLVVPS